MTETLAQGRYRVERTLGGGGMAIVQRAEDTQLQRRVAIKLLAENLLGDGDLRERFVREARLAARLSHPNVVHVFDAGESNGRPYIVMEYVPGETVAQLLRRRRKLTPAEAVDLAVQACAGVQDAHDHGLIHRDVKPQNLIVRDDGVLKVADFGIARTADVTELTQRGTVLGTAAYLSPEQAAGEEVTPAADIYSLGAVLYEMLTGRTPYEFGSLAELAHKQSSDAVVPVRDLEPGVPDALEAAVMRSLARDPQFRPASAADLGAELTAALESGGHGGATAVTVPLRRRRFWSIAGAGAWLWIVGAALLAVVALVLGLAQLGGGGSSPKQPQRVRVATVPRGASAADEALNLSAWLRQNSR
jgi:eukaryotic-like serine/threonine-protein kinase